MFSFFKKKQAPAEENKPFVVKAYLSGKVVPIEEVKDEVFSSKALGDGLAIIPSGELICAPCTGTISMVAEGSNHAVGMTLANGAEILIHVGLDTVSLNGKGFKILVKEGQKVKPGTKLLKFDKSFIESEGFDTACVFVLTNCEDFPDVRFFTGQDVVQNETVICSF